MTWPRPITCLVTDRRRLAPASRTWRDECAALLRLCRGAIAAGVTIIQLRERDVDTGRLATLARDLVRAAAGSSTRIVVNDRADVAHASGAHGVHLRSDGVPAARVRAWTGDRWTIGRSVHAIDEVRHERAADYLLFGTVFPTASKPGQPACGASALSAAVRSSATPVLAIGGVTAERVDEVALTGAAGVAAIGLFLPAGCGPEALGPHEAVRAIRAAFDRAGRVT